MLTNSKSPVTELGTAVEAVNTGSTSIHSLFSHFFRAKKVLGKPPRVSNDVSGRREYVLIEHGCGDRLAAEKFIARCFAQSFGARVDAFMPRLFTVRKSDGSICGAFGLRSAQRKLFNEQYLEQPIERAITARVGSVVERRGIVEVGHFSSASSRALRALILLLIERLHHEGFEWVAFAATIQLRNALLRMGLFPIDLDAATAAAIPVEARGAWGRYYDHAPRVLAGRIRDGFGALTYATGTPSGTRSCA